MFFYYICGINNTTMSRPRSEKSQNLNVIRVNVDITDDMKSALIEHKKKVFSGYTSAWLCTLLDGFLENEGKSIFLTPELIAHYETLPNIKSNNLGFYITKEQAQKIDILCNKNMRNRKQYLTLFVYSIYNALVVSK